MKKHSVFHKGKSKNVSYKKRAWKVYKEGPILLAWITIFGTLLWTMWLFFALTGYTVDRMKKGETFGNVINEYREQTLQHAGLTELRKSSAETIIH